MPTVEQWDTVGARRAVDIDERGRVLAIAEGGRLLELDHGSVTTLATVPRLRRARYLPTERVVVAAHGGGIELLRLGARAAEPVPITDRPDAELLDVLPGRVVYTSGPSGADVLIRNVLTGEEQAVYDLGGPVREAAVSPDSRRVAISRAAADPAADQVLLVDTMPATEDEHVLALTGHDERAARTCGLRWAPGGEAIVASTNHGEPHTAIARYEMATAEWQLLISDPEHELRGWTSPDGGAVLVRTDLGGTAALALHDARTGEGLHRLALPSPSWVSHAVWSPDSAWLVLSVAPAEGQDDIMLIDAATGEPA